MIIVIFVILLVIVMFSSFAFINTLTSLYIVPFIHFSSNRWSDHWSHILIFLVKIDLLNHTLFLLASFHLPLSFRLFSFFNFSIFSNSWLLFLFLVYFITFSLLIFLTPSLPFFFIPYFLPSFLSFHFILFLFLPFLHISYQGLRRRLSSHSSARISI